MRIVHCLDGRCNPESANGVDKVVYHLSRTQARLGHEVAVFSVTDREPFPIVGVEVRSYRSMAHLSRLCAGWFVGGWNYFAPPSGFLEDLKSWCADWVHFHSVYIPMHITVARFLYRQGIPYCISPHGGLDVRAQRRRYWLKRLFNLGLQRRYIRQARFIHSVGSADDDGIRVSGVHNSIVRAPNCIDLSVVPHVTCANYLVRRFPQIGGKRIFLFLGRLDPEHKGLDVLLRGFARARRRDVALVLVGPDWRGSRRYLGIMGRRLGLQDNLVVADPAYGKEKWEILASADVFVHVSRWEASPPIAVLEAMAVGLPCLLSAVVDPECRIENAGAALRIQPEPASIADGISLLADLPTRELRFMGWRARHVVREDFCWERTAQILLNAYEHWR